MKPFLYIEAIPSGYATDAISVYSNIATASSAGDGAEDGDQA